MGLFKENYTNQFGVPSQYWKIVNININNYYKWCDIEVRGFYSQETRDANKEAVDRIKIRANWNPEEYGQYFSPTALESKSIFINAYEYIKTKDFFSDCIDN